MDYPGNGDFRGRREASMWQQLNQVLRVLLAIAGILVIISLFLPQHRRLTLSRAGVDTLETQVAEQNALLTRQTREANLLRTDPGYLEVFARDRLDVMKDGETIFRLEPRKR